MITPANVLGTRLGVYEVQSILGSGGMATVYRGFDHNLQRPVAIKVLSGLAASQPDFAERFRQEARMIARLRHPHIVQVYDFGVLDQVAYMVQELLPGQTLSERLAELAARNQPMPRREIVVVIQQLAAALDAAHAAGIIHRDLKPSNALYNAEGALVLTDFGIAKSMAPDATKTQTGIILGTPTYVSPEQARGEALTPASDIYALGVVLYELISGQPPFDSDTPLGIVLKHLHEPPPPIQPLRASVTPAVEAVVLRALAKNPEERYRTASELAQALDTAWPEPTQAHPPGTLHSMPTVAWQPPNPAGAAPTAEPIDAARSAAPGGPAAVAPSAHPPPPQPRRRFLPFLALLLGGLLFAGALLAWRSDGVSAPALTAPTLSAPEQATPESPTAGAPTIAQLDRLREILGTSASAAMRPSLEAAEQALAAGDGEGAAEALGSIQQQILKARREGTLSGAAMRDALVALQDIADRNGVKLPLEIG